MTARASVPLGKRPCDCLDICGDDPAVRTGRAAVCQARIARDLEMSEISERMELQRELAEQAAIECLRFGAQVRQIDGSDWLDISGDIERQILTEEPVPPAISALARAARYLVLTKRAEKHPTRLYVLRMLPQGGRRSTDRTAAIPTSIDGAAVAVRMGKARNFPAQTDPASRHAEQLATMLLEGLTPLMLREEPQHCGESIGLTVAMLWEARARIAELEARA